MTLVLIIILFLLAVVACAVAERRFGLELLGAAYDEKKPTHRLICLFAVLLCLASVPLFLSTFADAREDVPYPFEAGAKYYNPYMQQFDAFMKGKLELDVEVDERLLELENPYDYWERRNSGAQYMWDRALYDGKYYSYFGIAPIITVYFPYYLLTGALPGDSVTMAVFLFITALFVPLALFKWAATFGKRTPLWLLFIAAPTVFLSSGIFLICRGVTHFYYIAVAAGTAFLSAFLYLTLCAYAARRGVRRSLLLIAAGLCYALLLMSRLNIALLAAFVVLPGLYFMIIRRREDGRGVRHVLGELAALGAPVAAAAVFIMWFNAARFSGPLDFGTNYQLTVADVSTYKLRVSDIPFAIYNYFLAPAAESEEFPYITFSYIYATPDHYVYRDANLGMFVMPLTLGVLGMPALICSRSESAHRRISGGAVMLGLLCVAWLDFCKGGVIYRYTADLWLTAAFFAAVCLLTLAARAYGSEKLPRPAKIAILAAVGVFLLIAAAGAVRVCLINGNGNISSYKLV